MIFVALLLNKEVSGFSFLGLYDSNENPESFSLKTLVGVASQVEKAGCQDRQSVIREKKKVRCAWASKGLMDGGEY